MFKPHFGKCSCGCEKDGLVVVRKGFIKQCNERIKKEKKAIKIKPVIEPLVSLKASKAAYYLGKKDNKTKLIAELDKWFSLYIRLRKADKFGMVRCFTSGKVMHWKQSQAGHFISRRYYATRWDDINVQVQSYQENMHNQGNAPMFAKRITDVYGQKELERLYQKKNNKFKLEVFYLKVLINDYKQRAEELLKKSTHEINRKH